MAVIQITSCDTLTTYEVDYGGTPLLVGDVYFISFTSNTLNGCFTYNGAGTTPVDTVVATVPYADCSTCQSECLCSSVDVTISQTDLDSASGNTGPNAVYNGVVFYQYNTCVNPNPMVSEGYILAGTFTNSVCALTNQVTFSLFYYYQDDVVKDSTLDPFFSSYSVGGCCTVPTPTPIKVPTGLNALPIIPPAIALFKIDVPLTNPPVTFSSKSLAPLTKL